MGRWLSNPVGHYLLLLTAAGLLFFPALGGPSLWDIDEGNNAEAAREMLDAGDWVVPTFNYRLRVDKPALLYWLQILAYKTFGINEFAARLPSALAAVATILLVYELGRRLFDRTAALLGVLTLASTIGFSAAAHFANPDALLNLLTILTLFFFWLAFSRGQPGWFVAAGIAAGMATLAKGPVGVVLPFGVSLLFLLWNRRLALLYDRRLIWGALACLVVALPWFVLVGNETRAQFLRGFFGQHNVGRFLNTMENHRGGVHYYAVVLLVGLMPWSVFLGPTIWFAMRGRHKVGEEPNPGDSGRYRFLLSWIVVYLVFFTISATKLPNYILPVYAPSALLTARFLDCWRRGLVVVPAWVMSVCLGFLGVSGLAVATSALVIGGAWSPPTLRIHQLPALSPWAMLGAVPLVGAGLVWWLVKRQNRPAGVIAFTAGAMAFTGLLPVAADVGLDRYKAPRGLITEAGARDIHDDVRVACYQYFQPSLVFYCRREIVQLQDERQLGEFLRGPLRSYLILPMAVWEKLQPQWTGRALVLAQHHDFYRHCDVAAVTNSPPSSSRVCNPASD
jgi:4-amino-4-deoxy-L-arabinose transferase-like glycosyltransferase